MAFQPDSRSREKRRRTCGKEIVLPDDGCIKNSVDHASWKSDILLGKFARFHAFAMLRQSLQQFWDRRMPLHDDGQDGGGPGRRLPSLNVLGGRLEICSIQPMTGFFRNGCCDTSAEDFGSHTVCVVATAEFLAFSKSCGNDLSTPMPAYGFAGLKPGDRWCLCAPRWQEALVEGKAPRVVLRATHQGALSHCSLADLKRHAIDLA
jgi:uncharacterized protein (DUF2237 family)